MEQNTCITLKVHFRVRTRGEIQSWNLFQWDFEKIKSYYIQFFLDPGMCH